METDDAAGGAPRGLDDPRAEARLRALVGIAEHRLAVAPARLHPLLADADAEVRAAAAFALGKVGDASSLGPLHDAWGAADPGERHLRRQLLLALGDLGGAAALGPLLDGFAGWDAELREAALGFLSVRGDADIARPLLRRLLDQPLDAETRAEVAAALAR